MAPVDKVIKTILNVNIERAKNLITLSLMMIMLLSVNFYNLLVTCYLH